MELKKERIHAESDKASVITQTSIEEDINLAENKPDTEKILFSKGQIKIEEIKSGVGHAVLTGKLKYCILYRTTEGDRSLQNLEGNIPFHEDVHIQELKNGDHVTATGKLEDLTVGMINSRKLNLRALITFQLQAEEIREEEICVDLLDAKDVEFRQARKEFLEQILHKKDVFRIREELEVLKTMPNIEDILWNHVELRDLSVKAQDKKLYLQGEIKVSFIYQGYQEGENQEIEYAWYEKNIPVNGFLECQESQDYMIPDVEVSLYVDGMEIRNDIDQESRMVGMDASLEMDIRLYRKQSMDMIADLYGVTEEIVCCTDKMSFRKLVLQENDTIKMNESLKTNGEEGDILRICHTESAVFPDEIQIEAGDNYNIILSGILQIKILYETVKTGENAKANYASATGKYKYQSKMPISEDVVCDIHKLQIHEMILPEEMEVTIDNHETFEISAVISSKVLGYCMDEELMILDLKFYPIDQEKLSKIPGFAIYYVQPGDTLWQIGKKYYVTTERIKTINHLTADDIHPGDKLLIAK